MFAQLVSEPVAQPSQCKACGAGSLSEGREWWMDTGTIEEFYGHVYYCSVCFTQMADLANFMGPAKRRALESQVEDAIRELTELKEYLDALSTLGIDVGTISRFVSDHYVPLEGTERQLDSLIERAQDAAEPSDLERSVDVSVTKSRGKPKLSLS
jgi:hypothetical protein